MPPKSTNNTGFGHLAACSDGWLSLIFHRIPSLYYPTVILRIFRFFIVVRWFHHYGNIRCIGTARAETLHIESDGFILN